MTSRSVLKAGWSNFWVPALAAASVGVLLFGYIFGFDMPLARAQFWAVPENDMIIMTGGYEAFLREPWGLPLTMVSSLTTKPIPIVFTDSIPWVSVVLKASGVGRHLNPLGVFLALSYPLQALGMAAVLRAMGINRPLPLFIGSLMALLFPAWTVRQFGHIALCGHWILLFTLALTIGVIRQGLKIRHILDFALLAAIATGVHAYHLVPIAACLSAALLAEIIQKGWRAALPAGVCGAASLIAVAVSAWLLGYGETLGPTGGAQALGVYSMNMMGPVMPEASALLRQNWNGAWFDHSLTPTNDQKFEGYQYLGAPIVITLGALLTTTFVRFARGGRWTRAQLMRWIPLSVACLFLGFWAVGWIAYFGPWHVYTIPKPADHLAEMLAIYRSYGRFFWVVGYLLTALAMVWVMRLPRVAGMPLMIGMLALQFYDTSQIRLAIRERFSTADERVYPLNLENNVEIRDRPWVFVPTYYCNLSWTDFRTINQMNLMIVRSGGRTNTYGTARSQDGPCDQTPADYMIDAKPSDPRITVITGRDPGGEGPLEAAARRTDCYRFARGAICGWGLENVSGLIKVSPGELSITSRQTALIRMDQGVKPPNLTSGWAEAEPNALKIWSIARRAMLTVERPAKPNPAGVTIEFSATGFSAAPVHSQSITVLINGFEAGRFDIAPTFFKLYSLKVPPQALASGRVLNMTFDIPGARSSPDDPRLRGIGLQWVRVLN